MTDLPLSRPALVRRGLVLNLPEIGYNLVEALVSVAAGVVSGSMALVSFGVDSGIEVTSSLAARWRLRSESDPERRERAERPTHRIVGWSFLALAACVVVKSISTLWQNEAPEASPVGLVTLVVSVLITPAIARAVLDWWWADPVAALAMVPMIALQGLEGARGGPGCDGHC